MSITGLGQPVGLTQALRGDQNTLGDLWRGIKLGGFGFVLSVPLATHLNAVAARLNQPAASTAAAQTATVAGTIHTGDKLTLTADRGDGVLVSTSYTLTGAETTATLAAAALVAAATADPVFSASFTAANAAGVITVTAKRKGIGYNTRAFASTVSGVGATTTLTAGAATFAGATGLNDLLQIVD